MKIVLCNRFFTQDSRNEVVRALKAEGLDKGLVLADVLEDYDAPDGKKALGEAKTKLTKRLEGKDIGWILSLGNEALYCTTGRSGITKYRGEIMEHSCGAKVFPTISPGAVAARPGMRPGWLADLRFFAAQVLGRENAVLDVPVRRIDNKDDLRAFLNWLRDARVVSYDVETVGDSEFAQGAAIVCLCAGDGNVVWQLPLYHPESWLRNSWRKALQLVGNAWPDSSSGGCKQIAHNGKFDARWMRKFGVDRATVTFDTMLACHVLDENREKGLKPQARSRLGVASWGIDTKNLLDYPLDEVLEYCAKDVFYTYHIYLQVRDELKEKVRQLRVFRWILTPANQNFIGVEQRGIWVDRKRLISRRAEGHAIRDGLEAKLMQWVPEVTGEEERLVELVRMGWPTKGKRLKLVEPNFNASNFARWWLFDHLGLSVIRRGKDKEDGSVGAPSMAEDVLKELRDEHPCIEVLLERATWQKHCSSFLDPYEDLLDENDRIHTTFKLAGTVTGRLSSGKADLDKVTAKNPVRGVNLQQVPRDPFIRGLFGAPPGRHFLQADFSQIELRIVAYLSRDPTMLHLYQTGQDIHLATASWVLGKPASQITKEDRKKAKAVNFGFVYGMGAKKFVATAFEKYDLRFSIDEAAEIRRSFFQQFGALLKWHARQRKAVQQRGYVTSPLGRVRHLPDIRSRDEKIRAEAERQAINSPVQSFASDMTVLAMNLATDRFKDEGVDAHILGLVHDAMNVEVADSDREKVAWIVKECMEDELAKVLKTKFGVEIDVPIQCDISWGRYWGEVEDVEF